MNFYSPFLALLFFVSISISAQSSFLAPNVVEQLKDYRVRVIDDLETEIGYSVGFSFEFGNKRNGSLKAYANIGFLQKLNKGSGGIILGGQSHIEFYRGGVGTSVLDGEKFKINIELRNSLLALAGFESGNRPNQKPAFTNVGSEASSLFDPFDYSFGVGTTFVNGINHSRNQRVGFLSASANQFNFQYVNDGPPFGKIGLGDRYDRYWTGGGQLGLYFNSNTGFITSFVLRFDNYTGYQPNLYEVGSLLRIDNLPYKVETEQMYNQARFQYKLGIQNAIFINVGVHEPKWTDIQHIIHYRFNDSPFHARPLKKRHTIGLEYMYQFNFDY